MNNSWTGQISNTLKDLNHPDGDLMSDQAGLETVFVDGDPYGFYVDGPVDLESMQGVDSPYGSGICITAIDWIAQGISRAIPRVMDADGEEDTSESAMKLKDLLDNPMADLTWPDYSQLIVYDMGLGGYARIYAEKTGGFGSLPSQLVYFPFNTLHARYSNGELNYYAVVSGTTNRSRIYKFRGERLMPENVINFRWRAHPERLDIGITPLAYLSADIYADSEAAGFTATMLNNLSVMGLMVILNNMEDMENQVKVYNAQQEDPNKRITVKDIVTNLETNLTNKFSGAGKGKVAVLASRDGINTEYMMPDLSQFDLASLRNVPADRIAAALRIHPEVLGVHSGDRSGVFGISSMRELIRMSWHTGIIPIKDIIERSLNKGLAPYLTEGQSIKLDISHIEELREYTLDDIIKIKSGFPNMDEKELLAMLGL